MTTSVSAGTARPPLRLLLLRPPLATVLLLLLLRPAHAATAAAQDFAPGGRAVAVLFPSRPTVGGAHPQLSPHDAAALWSQLRHPDAPSAGRSAADCRRERRELGVGRCWASTPCDRLISLTAEDGKAQGDATGDNERDCDMLLYWLDDSHLESRSNDSTDKPSTLEVWGYGILSTGLISLSGIGGIFLYPIMTKGYFKEVMNFLIGLAFGSLSATSIFQLIPESFGVMEFDEDFLTKASICWGSVWIFYNIGVFTTIISGKRKHSHGHSHIHLRENHDIKSCEEPQPTKNGLEVTSITSMADDEENKEFLKTTEGVHSDSEEKINSKKITAVMIIFGDGLHNFVDGMSIGAGYSQSLATGLSISLGVACEEFPHEFGDFAVLIKSGFSFKRALKFNYASASTIFLGLITGTLLGQLDASIYIYAFAGGLFLYISLGELVPELKEMINEEKRNGLRPSLVAYSLQNLGMLIGVLALFLVTKYL